MHTSAAKRYGAAILAAVSLFSISSFATQKASADEGHDREQFSIALIGDMPYDALGAAQAPNVIAEINASKVKFSLFDGDTMSGKKNKCTDAAYPALKTEFFDTFRKQVFYSIGDNEWVDCDRAVKGAFDPLGRLALVRSNFFVSGDEYINLGQKRLKTRVLHNSDYPEMQIFSYRGITVVIPHVTGSANNAAVQTPAYRTYNDTAFDGDAAEFAARDAANVAWINRGFEIAQERKSLGVIVVVQADMDWQGYFRNAAAPNNEYTQAYDNIKQALLTNSIAFKRPVLLQNGDSHWFQVDMPMNETAGHIVEGDKGSLVENFTRVQTFGSGFNHWVELTINPEDSNLWEFQVHLVKANLATH